MDGKGRAIDNIFIERFWRTTKYEQSAATVYLYQPIEEYMRFYNYKKPHDSREKETSARKFGQIKTNIISTKYSTTLV